MWRKATPVDGCTPGWSTAGARAALGMHGAPLGPCPQPGLAPSPWAPQRSPPPVCRGGPGCARPPLSGPCRRPGRRPLGCSRCHAWSHPGSSPALHRSAGRRVRPRAPLRAVPRHRRQSGGFAHQLSPVQWPRFHARQRACTLPAGGAGPAGVLPAGASGIISRSECASVSSWGGSPSLPGSPSAMRTSCAASSVGDRGRVLRGAVGCAIAMSLCLRAGDGVRTSCGLPAPVTACFAALAVGVVGCGWGGLTLAPHCTSLQAGAERCSPGPAGRLCARGGLVPPRLRGAFDVRRSPSSGRPLVGWAASPLTGARGVRRWALPLPGYPSLGPGSPGSFATCVVRGCAGVASRHCPFGPCALRAAAHRGVGGWPFRGGGLPPL